MKFILGRQLTKIHSAFLFVIINLFVLDYLVDVILKSLGTYHPIYVLLNRYLKYLLLRSAHK